MSAKTQWEQTNIFKFWCKRWNPLFPVYDHRYLIHIMSLIQHKWQLFDDLDWDVPVKQDVTHAGCSCDYHYHGKPGDWSLLLPLPWGEASRHWTLHLGQTTCAPLEHACGLNNTMVIFSSFFFFAVKERETSESGCINDLAGRGRSWGFLLRATNGWSHLKQAAADKERVNPPENTWPLWEDLNSLNSLSSYFLLVLMTSQIKNLHSCLVKPADFYHDVQYRTGEMKCTLKLKLLSTQIL